VGQPNRSHQAVDTVRATEPKRALEQGALFRRRKVAADVALVVIGVKILRPAHPLHIGHRDAEEVEVASVHEVAAGGPVDPDQHGGMIGQRAKRVSLSRSTVSARLRSVIFHEHVDSADDPAIGVTHWRVPSGRFRPRHDPPLSVSCALFEEALSM
jgi:hypothetical protein